jgi:hypothetical protein
MRSLSPVFLGLPTLPTLPEPSAAANDPKKKAGATPAAAVLSDSSSSSDSSSDDRLVKDYFFLGQSKRDLAERSATKVYRTYYSKYSEYSIDGVNIMRLTDLQITFK